MAGVPCSDMAGVSGSDMAGVPGSDMAGVSGSDMSGVPGSDRRVHLVWIKAVVPISDIGGSTRSNIGGRT